MGDFEAVPEDWSASMKVTRSLQLDRTLSLHDATPPARAPKPGTAHCKIISGTITAR